RSQGGQYVVSYLPHAGYPAGAAEYEVEPGEAEAEEVPQLAGHLRGRAGDHIWPRLGIWIDADAEVEDAADVVWPPACRLGRSVYSVPHSGDLFGRHVAEGGDPAVGGGAGERECARPEGAQPHWDRAGGLGLHLQVTDAVVAPVLGIAGACPGTPDDLDGFS